MSKSPNHYNGRNGWKPDIICCHVTEGGFSGSVSWLCNPAASASSHFVVGANGQKEQLVDFKDAAWCNGNTTNTDSRLYYKNATNPIVKSRAANANYYTYSIEHEGYSYKERYGALTEPQYQATLEVIKSMITDMKNTYGITFTPDREHLIGHYEIDPTGKPNCPSPNKGANFPFERLLADIKAWMGVAKAETPAQEQKPADNTAFNPYIVKVTADVLNIRTGPGTNYGIAGSIKDKGSYTIVGESNGAGANLWGKLKSGAGWIALDYTSRTTAAVQPATAASIKVGDIVKVKPGAKTYTGGGVASFVYSGKYRVDELKNDRAVLDRNGICTPVNVKDLILA